MATVRPGTFPAEESRAYPQAEELEIGVSGLVTVLEQLRSAETCGISQARVIVSGGAGIGSKEGFAKLQGFAEKLGAALGASRCAVDLGYAPYSAQVGITGVTVSPRLYIAVGISGAVQHLSGMSGAETVIAINQDPKAPIFQYADYGIVGDWETIINQLEELL
jgi:electron transfer flavoprotein alpha subunit